MERSFEPAATYIPPSEEVQERHHSRVAIAATMMTVAAFASGSIGTSNADAPIHIRELEPATPQSETAPAPERTIKTPIKHVATEHIQKPIKQHKTKKNRSTSISNLKVRNHKDCSYVTQVWSGYPTGMLCDGDNIKVIHNSYSGKYGEYVIGRRRGQKAWMCGYVDLGKLRGEKARSGKFPACNDAYQNQNNRNTIGKAFNCAPHQCVSGKNFKPSEACDNKLYRNYSTNSKSDVNAYNNPRSGFYDKVGKIRDDDTVAYRYTRRGDSKDGKAIWVASRKYGWGYMRIDCIKGIPRKKLLGGAALTNQTVIGLRPNAASKSKKVQIVTAKQVLQETR